MCVPAYHYHIVLNFLGSKFSQMVVFDDFVEIISQITCSCRYHAYVYAAHVMYMGVAYNQVLSNTHCHTVVRTRACSCKQSNAYLKVHVHVSLWRPSLVDSAACCPSMLLLMKTVVYM